MFSDNDKQSTPSTIFEDNSLLIQFILVEFIQIYHAKTQITSLIKEQFSCLLKTDELVLLLAQLLTQLVGELPHHEKSPSRWTKGSLTKFKEYCEHCSHNLNHNEKQHVLLYRAAHHAWVNTMHCSQMITSWHRNMSNKNSQNLLGTPPLKKISNTLHMCFNQLIRYIPKTVSSYSDNENVILCLLKKKDQFAEIYGIDFLNKYFKWPFSTERTLEVLMERYQERGYSGLLSIIFAMQEKKAETYAPF